MAIDKAGISSPSVVLTDFDDALKKALGQVSGDTQQQLCFWHIKKNIEAQLKKKWLGKLKGCKIMGQAKQDTARDAAEFDPNPSSQNTVEVTPMDLATEGAEEQAALVATQLIQTLDSEVQVAGPGLS